MSVPAGAVGVEGDLRLPSQPRGLVIVPHGSGASRFSRRSRRLAARLGGYRFATLLLDLLTADEAAIDVYTGEFRADSSRLGPRAVAGVDWVKRRPDLARLAVGLLAVDAGVPAALVAAAERPRDVAALVAQVSQPSSIAAAIERVKAPTLLIVAEGHAAAPGPAPAVPVRRQGPVEVATLRGASPPGAGHTVQDRVADLAAAWFDRHLAHQRRGPAP
ncbi:MAG: hypothetical protein AB7O28_23860 [Vicinamibacterales bacterium]